MTGERPILIVGAGLGGVAAALGLARQGRRVTIIEETPELGVIGYGIQLGPNVFPHLRKLGAADAVLAHAHRPPRVQMLDAVSGEEILGLDTGPRFVERFGDPYVCIHRVDLHRALLALCEGLPGLTIRPATGLANFEDRGDHVVATTLAGERIEAEALIGADGLGSTTRAALVREERPRASGFVAHRSLIPMSEAPTDARRDAVILWGGDGYHIVQYPLRERSLFNIVAVFRTANYDERGDAAHYQGVVAKVYKDAHPTMKAILERMNYDRRWVIADRDPIRRWGRGRVTMLGDAAHPTLQSFAQGACMALEDAAILAERVGAESDVERAFRAYEDERYLRTARVVLESRSLWEFYHLGGVAAEVRDASLRGRSMEETYQCLAWLYDGTDGRRGEARA